MEEIRYVERQQNKTNVESDRWTALTRAHVSGPQRDRRHRLIIIVYWNNQVRFGGCTAEQTSWFFKKGTLIRTTEALRI